MSATRSVSLLVVLFGYFSLGAAQDVCSTYSWDAPALRAYCTIADDATYRSPACSVYRLCARSWASSATLRNSLCDTDRLFMTLCADQPELRECSTFQRRFDSTAQHIGCVRSVALKLWSSDAVQSSLSTLCTHASSGHAAECSLCSAERCVTADPLLTYSAICAESPGAPECGPWAEMCAQEAATGANAVVPVARTLCPMMSAGATTHDRSSRVVSSSLRGALPPPPPPADPCVTDPTKDSCKSYRYPDAAALLDIGTLCTSMPDMPGCAITRACQSGEHLVSAKYCRPFVLLATLCHDMPGMHGCENYRALCTQGSVVDQCVQEPQVPKAPTWKKARDAVFSACDDHPMAGCANCTRNKCPDPLASLADICHEMPDMAACAKFWDFCDAAGRADMAEWCAEDDSKYLPSMLMYFHQRTQELLLWKEWRPRTKGAYIASVVAIVAMGVVTTVLKTAKGMLVLQWNHERAISGVELRVTSIWLPRDGQVQEILIKSAITGVSLTLDYFNMLIAMTFNVGFFCAVIGGYIIGTLLCGHVLENYAAILHQQRRDAAALMRKCAPAQPLMNGRGRGPANGGSGGDTANGRISSDEEESEEKLLMVIEGEGECNCVHSA